MKRLFSKLKRFTKSFALSFLIAVLRWLIKEKADDLDVFINKTRNGETIIGTTIKNHYGIKQCIEITVYNDLTQSMDEEMNNENKTEERED